MRQFVFFLSIVFSPIVAFNQSKFLFEDFNFDTTYQIVAVLSPRNVNLEYEQFTFIIRDAKKLNLAKKTISHGEKPGEPVFGENAINVHVIKDKKILKTYNVSPKYGHVSYYPTDSTHEIFKFDMLQLLQLADSKPLRHSIKYYNFKGNQSLDSFLIKNRYARNFLGYEDVSEELTGKFSVVIEKKGSIQTIKDASTLVNTELKNIAPNKEDYLCGFNLTKSNATSFTFDINADKDLYEKFKLKNCKKSSWSENTIEISALWTK